MTYLVFGLALLAVFLLVGRALTRVPAAQIAKHARFGGIALLVGLAALLLLTGRIGTMTQVMALAGQAMRNRHMFRGRPKGFDDVRAGSSPDGPAIRTRYLQMQLDEGSGEISGSFIAGPWSGRELAHIPQAELVGALDAMRDDGESVRLLEAYLDRSFAGWREDHDERARGSGTGTADAGGMGHDEAYEVLGLEPGADAETIRTAHRRLMSTIHPDRGGSTYLAAKVNLAKEVLLKLHGGNS
jgi:hypothetical protein